MTRRSNKEKKPTFNAYVSFFKPTPSLNLGDFGLLRVEQNHLILIIFRNFFDFLIHYRRIFSAETPVTVKRGQK
jgi:hypothetical protein